MKKIEFQKAPKSKEEQLEILKNRGMVVKNEERALFLLEHISYYRLSGYWFENYIDWETKMFRNGTSFEDSFDKYCFDKEFRKLVLSELEKIEVSIRASIINTLSIKYSSPFWFQNVNLFKDVTKHTKLLEQLDKDFFRSDELFVQSFKKKYIEKLPPSWIILEITSFGTLSKIFENLKPYDKRLIANKFELPEKVFVSWLHTLIYIRNVCAHHTRLWNRNLTISPKLLNNETNNWSKEYVVNNKSYFVVLIIRYILKTINPKSTFKDKLVELFKNYPMINPNLMGFSENWEQEQIWQS
ncbi:MAG: Abi family protein [Desulfobulbaceae bacterium]|nr:Abi family protein [Desulfobulbaceae bacterium]